MSKIMIKIALHSLVALVISLALLASAGAQTGQLEIKDAWARATPAGADAGAAYMTIVSPISDRLVGIATPVAKQADLHTMTMEGGVMKMRPLAGVDLPGGQPVTLKPGGMHMMLMGLNQPLKEGETVRFTLTFEKQGTREINVAVQKAGAMGPGQSQPPQGQGGQGQGAPGQNMGSMPMHH